MGPKRNHQKLPIRGPKVLIGKTRRTHSHCQNISARATPGVLHGGTSTLLDGDDVRVLTFVDGPPVSDRDYSFYTGEGTTVAQTWSTETQVT